MCEEILYSQKDLSNHPRSRLVHFRFQIAPGGGSSPGIESDLNPSGFQTGSRSRLEPAPGAIQHMKCTNRLLGCYGSSYWHHTIFLHMRSCRCKNFEFWSPGTQVTFFCVEFDRIFLTRNLISSKPHQFGTHVFPDMDLIYKGHFPSENWVNRTLGTISEILESKKFVFRVSIPETVLKGVNWVSERLSQI